MKRILIAEDNPANQELILEILDGMGYEPILAADGAEALRKADEAPPDLVLLDIQMPVMDGFEVLHELRKNPRFMRLPIFAMTAYAMRGDQEKILAAGFDGNFSKPVNVSLLRSRIQEILETQPD